MQSRSLRNALAVMVIAGCGASTPYAEKTPMEAKQSHADIWQMQLEEFPWLKEWFEETVAEMKHFKPRNETKPVSVTFSDSEKGWARVELQPKPGGRAWCNEGLLRLNENEWVLVSSIGSHSGYNVALAIDHNGRLYRTYAHVCADILGLKCEPGNNLRSLEDFLKTKVRWGGGLRGPEFRQIVGWERIE